MTKKIEVLKDFLKECHLQIMILISGLTFCFLPFDFDLGIRLVVKLLGIIIILFALLEISIDYFNKKEILSKIEELKSKVEESINKIEELKK